jgi:cysteinyl-tRNA synthetase
MLDALAFLGRLARNLVVLAAVAGLQVMDGFRDNRLTSDSLQSVRSWGYQLQRLDLASLAASRFGGVVIDYVHLAKGNRPFRPSEIKRLAERPDGGRRIVLAYMSIGEAETYRFYWQHRWLASPPAWLGGENPRWRRNYIVRFWQDDWQQIVLGGPGSYLDRIIKAGFDGVYLDRVDVYAEWQSERPRAKAEMIAFVRQIAEEARKRKPGFKVVVQNAEELVDDREYLAIIDGLAKEDLLFGEKQEEEANEEDEIAYSIGQLQKVKAAGKAVWIIEYLADAKQREVAARRLADLGFVHTFATRALDRVEDP